MKVNKAFKCRIYPNKEQGILLNKTIGSCRFLYNSMLGERISVYEKYKDNSRELYEYKYKTEKEYKQEFEWLNEIDSISLQQSRRDLSSAYQNFFKSLSGKRKSKSGFPKFHKKGRKDSYRTINVNNNIKIDWNLRKIKLPVIGWLNYRDQRSEIEGKIKSATISKTKTGKFFVSILLEREIEDLPRFDLEEAIEYGFSIKGLDMSLDKFYVDENGKSPDYIRYYRKGENQIAHLQSKLSRKQKGSNNKKKAQLKINKIYEKIANSRKDFIEKLSTKLVNENDIIVVENLNMHNMSQALKLGKSVMDLGWGMFINRLQQKADEKGKLIIRVDKWFASSKICHVCGYHNKDLQLSDREWECPICHTHLHRDQNAAINLSDYGLHKILEVGTTSSACGDALNGEVVKQEAVCFS